MGKSSISIDVKAANSKLAQSLRRREEEEASLGIGKRKIREEKIRFQQSGGGGKKAKWTADVDFTQPTPMVDRPRTTTGSTSFHFSHTSVSKQGSPTLKGKPIQAAGGTGASSGVDHAKYIEREGAAERIDAAVHAAYVEREGAAERLDPFGEIAEANERERMAIVGESPMEDEAAQLGPEAVVEGVPSVFSNISDDQFEREEYWRAVHRSERDAQTHVLTLNPERSAQWWREMETSPFMDEGFRAYALQVRAEHEAWVVANAGVARPRPFQTASWERDAEECGVAIDGARKTAGWNEIDSPIDFESGRGGRVQFRFVMELPHEVSPEDRARIAQNFCDHLATLSVDAQGNRRGFMYTGVIHAPDAHNDRRNYHLHVIAHDRPARFMPEHNQWDFEVAETYKDPGSRKDRVRWPHRQEKFQEASRDEPQFKTDKKTNERRPNPAWHPGFNSAIAGQKMIPHLRGEFARIANAVMQEAGVERRYDPRTYKDMGIERTPTEHLGTKAAALEAIGVSTVIGEYNAIAIWRDAERAVEARAVAVDATLRSEQRDLVALAADVQESAPQAGSLRTLRALSAERAILIEDVADDRRLIMTFDQTEAKAKSRAVRTRQTCLQFLADIDGDKADRSLVRLEPYIRDRYAASQKWIEDIDRRLAPDRPKLAAAAEDVRVREDRIRQIDATLVPLKAALANAAREGREERERRRRQEARDRSRSAVEAAERMREATQLRTVRDPRDASRPTTTTDPTTTSINRELTNAERTRLDRLVRTGGAAVAAREPDADRPSTLQQAGTLAGVLGLSRGLLVRDHAGPALPLQHLPDDVLERRGAAGDGVRRQGEGGARDAGRDRGRRGGGRGGGERGLTDGAATDPLPPSVEPPSIEGVPLVRPTIDPEASPIAEAPAPAPAGSEADALAPLRPVGPALTPSAPDDRTAVDLGPDPVAQDGPQAVQDGRGAPSGAVRAPEVPDADRPSDGPPAEPIATPPERVDRRRRDDEATLFPMDHAPAPVKPGTTRAEYEDWDALVNRISRERIAVTATTDARGRTSYDVPALSPDERAVLDTPRFAKRTASRLGAVAQQQRREVDRMIRWIQTQGKEPSRLVIEGRTARIGEAPESVKRLMRDWRAHPDVVAAIRAENQRRVEAARAAPRDAARTRAEALRDAPATDDRARRAAEAAAGLPLPEAAATPQVAELVRRLRAGADPRSIQEAADAVAADAVAREDVHRHRVELSRAYQAALVDDVVRRARGRAGRSGR